MGKLVFDIKSYFLGYFFEYYERSMDGPTRLGSSVKFIDLLMNILRRFEHVRRFEDFFFKMKPFSVFFLIKYVRLMFLTLRLLSSSNRDRVWTSYL